MLILPATIDVITTIQARCEPFFDLLFVFAYPTKLVPSVPLRTWADEPSATRRHLRGKLAGRALALDA